MTIPLVIKGGEKFNIFDKPDSRKQHKNSIVGVGGISILLGFISSLFFFDVLNQNPYSFLWENKIIISLIVAIFFVGLIDDIWKISPWPRLTIEVILASIAWTNDLGIYTIDFPFFNFYANLVPIMSYLVTVFWIVGVLNSINWIDGLDGLASGVVCLISFGMCYVSYSYGNFNEFIFLIVLSGICIGFLKSNFYPSKILMGDGGSYMLGFATAIFSTTGSSRYVELIDKSSTSIAIPIILLLIPLLDMAYVVSLRIINKKSPFFPDRNHIHHRLIDKGVSHKNTVIIINLFVFINVFIALNLV